MMDIRLTDRAVKQLEEIAASKKTDALRIIDKIKGYADNPKAKHDVKKLKGRHEEMFRLRVGNFRIIFTAQNATMIVAEIKHRQGAYND